MNSRFEEELRSLLNQYSVENDSDTPDFVLASYLLGCLNTYKDAVRARDKFWGFKTDNTLATPTPEYCDNCDGVGWYEGGRTLQTTCTKCGGSGLVNNCTPVVEPIHVEADGAGQYQIVVCYAFGNKEYRQVLSKKSVQMLGVEEALYTVHPALRAFPITVFWVDK